MKCLPHGVSSQMSSINSGQIDMLVKDIFPSLQHIKDVSRWNKQALQKRHVFGCGSWYLMVSLPFLKSLAQLYLLCIQFITCVVPSNVLPTPNFNFEEKIKDKECNDSCKRKY